MQGPIPAALQVTIGGEGLIPPTVQVAIRGGRTDFCSYASDGQRREVERLIPAAVQVTDGGERTDSSSCAGEGLILINSL